MVRQPVILVTDIGEDIDDTWALGLLLSSPELELKLAVGESGKAGYRARLLAKFLQTAGYNHIPIAAGVATDVADDGPQLEWIDGYNLKSYPGPVLTDSAQAIIETIMQSPEVMTVISIAPMNNIASALTREPKIADRARFVGMCGSVYRGYDGSFTPCAEWNVKAAPQACQKAFSAPWDKTITPLDTCGLVTLQGERLRSIMDSKSPIASSVIENYCIWSRNTHRQEEIGRRTTALFDTVAVYLAFSRAFCKMERLPITVLDSGMTVIGDEGSRMSVATEWKDLEGYKDLLVHRLVRQVSA